MREGAISIANEFPDPVVQACVKDQLDRNGDGYLSDDELERTEYLRIDKVALNPRVSGSRSKAKSLEGINCLKNLKRLYCVDHELQSLDVSGLTSLTELACSNNQITNLDVSGLPSLTNLECLDNKLTSLKVNGAGSLQNISCSGNELKSIDVSGLVNLNSLSITRNQLSKIDVSKNTKLTHLDCILNKLTSLDVSNNKDLETLSCGNNQLTALNVSNNTKMKELQCNDNRISSLDVRNCPNLVQLDCGHNSFRSLDISKNSSLLLAYSFGDKTEAEGTIRYTEYDKAFVWHLLAVDKSVNVITKLSGTYDLTTGENTSQKSSPQTTTLTAKGKTFKAAAKTKKYTVTLKDANKKAIKNAKLTLKVNGKSYTAKTNSKGNATFKITKLKKKGTFKAVIKYAGDKKYKPVSKSVKITVKK